MSDVIDRACEAEGLFLEDALARCRRTVTAQESELHCLECGDPIPEARRQAVRGCTLCVDCQEDLEKETRYG